MPGSPDTFRSLAFATVTALSLLWLGGCSEQQYPQRAELRLQPLARFPSAIDESSALARGGGSLWTVNDSGDEAILYRLSEAGELQAEVRVEGAENVDWESLAQDRDYLYVADIGNNFNMRGLLTIYRIPWPEADAGSVRAQTINLSYSDRERGNPRSHNFDAEALAVRGDELWLFTKNRGDGNTTLYRFPKRPGRYLAEPRQSLGLASLVTAADIHPQSGQLLLVSSRAVGRGSEKYLWLAPTDAHGVIWEEARVVQLGPPAQWEAVLWDPAGDGLLLSHEHSGAFAGLSHLPLDRIDWLPAAAALPDPSL